MNWRSALLLLLLGFALGATVFLLAKGGLAGLPTSPGGGDRPQISLIEEAPLAEKRIARRFPEARAARKAKRAAPEELRMRLYETDLRDLAIAGLARHAEGRRVLELAQEIRAEIDRGEIGLELVINLSRVPRDGLSERERETIEKIESLLPLIGSSNLPIGFYGSPEASRGRIRLGGRPWMKISILKLSLATVSERLGIPEQDLENSLELEWPGFEVLEVRVEGDALELRVVGAA